MLQPEEEDHKVIRDNYIFKIEKVENRIDWLMDKNSCFIES